MKARVPLAVACLVLLPFAAGAATFTVRSGEHDGFTRIAIDLAPATEWTVDRAPKELTIRLTDPESAFDIRNLFAKISRDRISDVTAGSAPATLKVALTCDCAAEVFQLAKGTLVVDVGDQAAASPEPASPEIANDSPAILPTITERTAPAPTLPFALGDPAMSAEANLALAIDAGDLGDIRRDLAQQMARAASQGLLVVDRTAPEAAAPEAGPSVPAAEPAPQDQPHLSNIQAETALDIAAGVRRPDRLAGGVAECYPDPALDIASWSETEDFAQAIGPLRRNLMLEFDRPDRDVALDLARAYLHFGFGAEAAQTLHLRNGDTPDEPEMQMARILEHLHDPAGGILAAQTGCDGNAALWAVLASATLDPDIDVNERALLRAFNTLPGHLRRYLGPPLSQRLGSAGRRDTAAMVLRAIERVADEQDSGLAMATADLSEATAPGDSAARIFESVSEAGDENSPAALVRRIDKADEDGTPIGADTAILVGAYAVEYGQTDIGPALRRAHIIALAKSGQFDAAFDLVRDGASNRGGAGSFEHLGPLMRLLARDADEITFLKHAFALPAEQATALAAETGNAIAERLVSAGFPALARTYLSADPSGEAGRARDAPRADLVTGSDPAPESDVVMTAEAKPPEAAPPAPQPAPDGAAVTDRPEMTDQVRPAPIMPALPQLSQGRALLEQSRAAREVLEGRLRQNDDTARQ